MRRHLRTLSLAPFAIALAVAGSFGLMACGSPSGSSSLGGWDTPPTHQGDAPDAGEVVDAAPQTAPPADTADAAPPNEVGCTDAMKLVYVVSEEKNLYSFAPATLTFTKIGALSCASADGGTSAKPTSMAVDRSGTAWVNYDDGEIFKVSTTDASCKATKYQPGQHGFDKLGMAFSMDSASAQSESLLVVGIDHSSSGFVGRGLASIDTGSYALTPIGDFSSPLAGKAAELTGTGDGKLYGFFTTSPASLAEIDKGTGAVMSNQPLTGVDVGDAWAFSFWGGDFWFYTAPSVTTSPGSTSSVTRLNMKDGSISVVKKNIGFRIVGAGVSTCVPLK